MPEILNILSDCTRVKGEIGELIASSYLKKLGFIVRKPRSVINLLYRSGIPNSYEVRFLNHHYKTMDYFAVWPRNDPLILDHEAICEVFSGTGLNRYIEKESLSKGFIVEVKTGIEICKSRPSKKQKRMFNLGRKLGFEIILANVSLKEDYNAEILLRNESGEDLF